MKSKLTSDLLLASLVFLLVACARGVSTPAPTAAVLATTVSVTQLPISTTAATESATQPPLSNTAATVNSQHPVGIIAIGHSGLTGESSNPSEPGLDAKENSWATGTTASVNSVYQRLVAVRPETADHVDNEARGGALAAALADQAREALQIVPTPELVLIQTIDNDIRCDGSDPANIQPFGAAVASALQVIVEASPNSHILLVGELGRPATYAAALANNPSAKAKFEGSGMCDFFGSGGSLNQEHIAALTAIIESYEAEQNRVCAMVPQCSNDGGAFASYVDNIADLFPGDWSHLTVHGHARLAELIWPVVSALLGLK